MADDRDSLASAAPDYKDIAAHVRLIRERIKTIQAPSEPVPERQDGDSLYERETRELELEGKKHQIRLFKLSADHEEQLLKQRGDFAKKFVWIAIGWLVFVGLIVSLSAVSVVPVTLSDAVMMFLLGTATTNVLAPAFLFAKYLFGKPK